MKVWLFFKKPDESNIHIGISTDEKSLYAITNNKDYAKQFMSERDMTQFILKKKNIEKDVWMDMGKENGDCILDIRYLKTRETVDIYDEYKKIEIPMLCTMYEYQTVDADFVQIYEMTPDFWLDALTYEVFNEKVKNALEVIQYSSFYRLMGKESYTNDISDYAAPDTDIDEVGCFVSTFHRLFK